MIKGPRFCDSKVVEKLKKITKLPTKTIKAEQMIKVPTQKANLCEWLWNETESIRNRALNTYFIQGIKDGTLYPTGFGGYMVQDSVYCYKAKGFLDTAACREEMGDLKEFLEDQSESYKSYYEDLFKRWHILDGDAIALDESCQDYVDCIDVVARTLDPIYILVASLPCSRLWPWLGQQLEATTHSYGVYTNWINENFDPTSTSYKELEKYVNEAYDEYEVDENVALGIYKRCMNGEANFFGSVPPL